MPRIGPTELIIILVIVLIIFGVGKLPQIGGAIGKSIREYRKAKEEPQEPKPAASTTAQSTQTENKEAKS